MSDFAGLDLSNPEVYKSVFGVYPPGYSATPASSGQTAFYDPGASINPASITTMDISGMTAGANAAPATTSPAPTTPTRRVFDPSTFQLTQVDRSNPDLLRATSAGGLADYFDYDATKTSLDAQKSSGAIDDDFYNKAIAHITPGLNTSARRHYTGIGRTQTGGLVNQFLQDIGVDPNSYAHDINQEMDMIEQGIDPSADPRTIAAGHFNRGGMNRIVDALNQRYRRNAVSGFNKQFSGDVGSEIADTADDEIINKIIGEQAGEGRRQIDMQFKRGALNDFGKASAIDALGKREGQVRSRLQDRGGALLEALRGRARGIVEGARTKVGQSSLENRFDPGDVRGQVSSTINSGLSGLEGSLRDLVSPDEFGYQDIIQGGQSKQGPINQTDPILAALETRQRIKSNKRGLGTTGAF